MTPKKTAGKTAERPAVTGPAAVSEVVQPGAIMSQSEGQQMLDSLGDDQRRYLFEWVSSELAARKRPAPRFVVTKDGSLAPDPKQRVELARAGIRAATGSSRSAASDEIIAQLAAVASGVTDSQGRMVDVLNALLAQCVELAPRDAVEGMLVAQMVTASHESLRLLSHAANTKTIPGSTFHYNQSARLMRLFASQMDALQRYRGKGPSEQRMTVSHVHVHQGGQAVVGNVRQGEGVSNGGTDAKS